jgi:hypothetical protein
MSPSKPYALIRALREYDPTLRCRWGTHTQMWIVEKQLPPRHKQLLSERPNPWKSPRGLDLYAGHIEGYVNVLFVHRDLADNVPLVMQHVADADFLRQGGIDAFTRRIEAMEDAQEQAADREIHNFNEAAAKEMHDRLAWLQGRRVAVESEVETS